MLYLTGKTSMNRVDRIGFAFRIFENFQGTSG